MAHQMTLRGAVRTLACVAIIGTGLHAPSAGAEGQVATPAAPAPVVQACMADAQRLCREVTPGGGRLIRCLEDRHDELSPQCRAGIAKARAIFGL